MKVLKCILILIFLVLVFEEVGLGQDKRDYEKWFKDYSWLMLKKEKKEWDKLESDEEREEFIELFWRMRDPDLTSFRNESKIMFEKRFEIVEKDYPDYRDARRFVVLAIGEPLNKRLYPDKTETFQDMSGQARRIQIGKSEVWEYLSENKKKVRIIFSQLDVSSLGSFIWKWNVQEINEGDEPTDVPRPEIFSSGMSPSLHVGEVYDILYIGKNYHTADSFLRSVVGGNEQVFEFKEWLGKLAKPILEQAEKAYKEMSDKPEVEKHGYPNGELPVTLQVYYLPSQEGETGAFVLLGFQKTALSFDSKRKRYLGDFSLFCKLEKNGKEMVRFEKPHLKFEYKKRDFDEFYFGFLLSAPPEGYNLIFKIGDNVSKTKREVVADITPLDFNKKGIKAVIGIGKMVKRKDIFLVDRDYNPLHLSKSEVFVPAIYFDVEDELVLLIDIYGFKRNNKGNPYIRIQVLIRKGDKELGKVVVGWQGLPIEKSEQDSFRCWQKVSPKRIGLGEGTYWVIVQIIDEMGRQTLSCSRVIIVRKSN